MTSPCTTLFEDGDNRVRKFPLARSYGSLLCFLTMTSKGKQRKGNGQGSKKLQGQETLLSYAQAQGAGTPLTRRTPNSASQNGTIKTSIYRGLDLKRPRESALLSSLSCQLDTKSDTERSAGHSLQQYVCNAVGEDFLAPLIGRHEGNAQIPLAADAVPGVDRQDVSGQHELGKSHGEAL